MDNLKDIEIATFEAKCSNCGALFDHPSFGDFAYGQFIFCTTDGRSYAYYEFSSLVDTLFRVLLPENVSTELYQSVIAEFADPIFGKKLENKIRCPSCASNRLDYHHGKKTGSMWVKPATYHRLCELKRQQLIDTFNERATNR